MRDEKWIWTICYGMSSLECLTIVWCICCYCHFIIVILFFSFSDDSITFLFFPHEPLSNFFRLFIYVVVVHFFVFWLQWLHIAQPWWPQQRLIFICVQLRIVHAQVDRYNCKNITLKKDKLIEINLVKQINTTV